MLEQAGIVMPVGITISTLAKYSCINYLNKKNITMNILKSIATAILMTCGITSFAQSKTETIKVSGNCEMCEKNIETAAKKAGATTAKWDEDTKILTVSYDESKTSNDAIQQKVASVGYDTEKYTGDEKAYKKLNKCCQYDNKKKAESTK